MNSVYLGDCRECIRGLIAAGLRVQCIVTSPPYFGLRDYGVAGQIGLEETPDEYVAKMVDVFRLARDLLREDGTLWLNLGDSYAGSWGSQGRQGNTGQMAGRSVADARDRSKIQAARIEAGAHPSKISRTGATQGTGYKAKDLMGIPWRVAFALQADGWWLRQDVIWHKPNAMPASVRDRCTTAHEYLFLLTKNARYYYDADAIAERAVSEHPSGNGFAGRQGGAEHMPMSGGEGAQEQWTPTGKRNRRSVWTIPTQPYPGAHFATFPEALVEPCILAGSRAGDVVFDPFMGSGTVAAVAQRLGRKWLGCELNPAYGELIEQRVRGTPGLEFVA